MTQWIFLLIHGLFAILVFFLVVSFFTGAPFVPTPTRVINDVFLLANLKKDMIFIDLGAGDGRVLIAAAKKGVIAKGWEINPLLVLWAKLKILLAGLPNQAHIYWNDYRRVNLSEADSIFLYGISGHMAEIEEKLKNELKIGTTVISYVFPLPTIRFQKKTLSKLYYYRF